jgi:hypothetical protein
MYRLIAAACLLTAGIAPAYAQYNPGTPDGVLSQDWKLQEHPQLEFAASSTEADQKNKVADKNRKVGADSGKENCNLQCPTEW